MPNTKTTETRQLSASLMAQGDFFTIVDTSEATASEGETKKIMARSLAEFVVSNENLQYTSSIRAYKLSRGLSFDGNYSASADLNTHCYGRMNQLGSDFSLSVKAFLPSDAVSNTNKKKVLFGVGSQVIGMADSGSRAYIGIRSGSLFGYISDGITEKIIEYSDFLNNFHDRTVEATITKDAGNNFKFYINSSLIGTLSNSPSYISSSYVLMGNGKSTPHVNIDCILYEAHVFGTALTAAKVSQNYYSGIRTAYDATLVASYTSNNLNPCPSQWLDCIGNNHILLPVSGACVNYPSDRFSLIFLSDGTSSYLGNNTKRDVLPKNYVLTDCFVYTAGKPLLSIGSTSDVAVSGSSGIYSFNNNRVPLVSASYNRNVLPLLELGTAHTDRSLYVYYSASAFPCTFSFEGYISKYGNVNYTPPAIT